MSLPGTNSSNPSNLIKKSIEHIESIQKTLESFKNANIKESLQKESRRRNKESARAVDFDDLVEALEKAKTKKMLTKSEKWILRRQIDDFYEEHGLNINKNQNTMIHSYSNSVKSVFEENDTNTSDNQVAVLPTTPVNIKSESMLLGTATNTKNFTGKNPYADNPLLKQSTLRAKPSTLKAKPSTAAVKNKNTATTVGRHSKTVRRKSNKNKSQEQKTQVANKKNTRRR